MSCVITVMGLSTSMQKWSASLFNSSTRVPTVSPLSLLIFSEFAPVAFNTFSTVIDRPNTSGLNASSPSFEITTTTRA